MVAKDSQRDLKAPGKHRLQRSVLFKQDTQPVPFTTLQAGFDHQGREGSCYIC